MLKELTILTIYTRNYFIWIGWIYRFYMLLYLQLHKLLYLQHLYHLQLLSTFRIKGLELNDNMIALEDRSDTSSIRQQFQTINREVLLKYRKYRHLTFPAEVICTIKELKIKKNFRGVRGKRRRRTWDMNKGIHLNVLRMLPMRITYKDTKNLVIGTANCQSVNKKTTELLVALHQEHYDICFLTETWIKKDDPRVIGKLEATSLKYNGSPREDREGGGIAILYHRDLKIQPVKVGKTRSYEYGIWNLTIHGKMITIIGIYRPPQSKKNAGMVIFLDEVSDHLIEWLSDYREVIIMGDINIHDEDKKDPDKIAYNEMLASFSLQQMVTCITHERGHTLDHIILRGKKQPQHGRTHTGI